MKSTVSDCGRWDGCAKQMGAGEGVAAAEAQQLPDVLAETMTEPDNDFQAFASAKRHTFVHYCYLVGIFRNQLESAFSWSLSWC